MRLVVDTETNAIDFTAWNLGDTSSLKTVHCVCALDIDERREYRWRGKDVRQGINLIALNSQEIIGFNLDFDYRVMCQNNRIVMPQGRSFYTWSPARAKVTPRPKPTRWLTTAPASLTLLWA